MSVYKNSPAYQTYMQAKSRNAPVIEDPEPKGTKSGERRIDIQQASAICSCTSTCLKVWILKYFMDQPR